MENSDRAQIFQLLRDDLKLLKDDLVFLVGEGAYAASKVPSKVKKAIAFVKSKVRPSERES